MTTESKVPISTFTDVRIAMVLSPAAEVVDEPEEGDVATTCLSGASSETLAAFEGDRVPREGEGSNAGACR